MEDIEGENPSKTKGELRKKDYCVDLISLDISVSNTRNPTQKWGSTTISSHGTRRIILPPISLQLLPGLCNILGMLYLRDQHKVLCYSWQTSLDGLSLLLFSAKSQSRRCEFNTWKQWELDSLGSCRLTSFLSMNNTASPFLCQLHLRVAWGSTLPWAISFC